MLHAVSSQFKAGKSYCSFCRKRCGPMMLCIKGWFLNVNKNSGSEWYARLLRYVSTRQLPTTGRVEKLLPSDASDSLFWFRCWSETEQKQSLLISQTACRSQPIVLFLSKPSLSILHDLLSQSSSLWHAVILAAAQGIPSTFFIRKENALMSDSLCVAVRHFNDSSSRCAPSLPFLMRQSLQYTHLN